MVIWPPSPTRPTSQIANGRCSNHCCLRRQSGREAAPSAAIIDSQSVKTTECGGPRGYDGAKKRSGRKRHLLVDTLGLVMGVVVHPADLQDRASAPWLLRQLHSSLPRLALIWADSAYQGLLQMQVWETFGWGSKWSSFQKVDAGAGCGPTRSHPCGCRASILHRIAVIVERTFAWIGRNRRMSKDDEFLPASSGAWIYRSIIRLMLRRLAPEQVEPAFHYCRSA